MQNELANMIGIAVVAACAICVVVMWCALIVGKRSDEQRQAAQKRERDDE